MKILINGEEKTIKNGLNLDQVLIELNLKSDYIAVAMNSDFIPRTSYADYALSEGDRIDILSPMQGG